FENTAIFAGVTPLSAVKSLERRMAPNLFGHSPIAQGLQIEHGHSPEFVFAITILLHGCFIYFEELAGFRVKDPRRKRRVRKQEAEHRFALAQRFFAAAALDGERDMAADRFQKFEVTPVVSVFILVVLNHQNADRFGWRSKRDAEPGGRGRADELDFAFGGKAVEFFLRNQLRL